MCDTAKSVRAGQSKRSHRQGAIVMLTAVCLVIVIAFLAFSIDYGYIVVEESELQNSADAGALSGARALSDGRDEAVAAALKWVRKNVPGERRFDADDDKEEDRDDHDAEDDHTRSVVGKDDVVIGVWDEDTAIFTAIPEDSSVTPNAVKVTCRRDAERGNSLKLFFASLLGTNSANLSVSAIAQNKGGSCGGIMALEKIYLNDRQVGSASYTDSYNSDRGDYPATRGQNGDICTNGHLTLNGNSFVNGDARWWEEANDPKADESQVSGELASFEKAIEFPEIDPGNAATSNQNNSIPFSSQGVQPLNNGVFQLDGAGDSVTLAPGTYYFSKMTVAGGATVVVTGPTLIYVEQDIDLRYGGIINTTRKPINLQIYPMGADTYFYLPFFGELHASIYSTKAHIYLDEKSEPVNLHFYGKMVGQKIRVWDTALHVDESISFGELESGGEQIGKSGVSLVQ